MDIFKFGVGLKLKKKKMRDSIGRRVNLQLSIKGNTPIVKVAMMAPPHSPHH